MKNKLQFNAFVLIYFCSTETAKEKIFYSYTQNINGFAAILDEEEAAEIASKMFNFVYYISKFLLF